MFLSFRCHALLRGSAPAAGVRRPRGLHAASHTAGSAVPPHRTTFVGKRGNAFDHVLGDKEFVD